MDPNLPKKKHPGGRPRKAPEDKAKPYQVYLYPQDVERLQKALRPGETPSELFRRLLAGS